MDFRKPKKRKGHPATNSPASIATRFTSENNPMKGNTEMAKQKAALSVEARNRRKMLQEAAKWILAENEIIADECVQSKLIELGVEDASNAEALMVIALRQAAKGDVDAMKFIRDTSGDVPSKKVELAGDPNRPVATLDLRNMSEDELLRLAQAKAENENK